MLKLPFFNRQRYVVLKCYIDNAYVNELAPIVLSSNIPQNKVEAPKHTEKVTAHSFKSCYGHIKSLKRSATVPMWTEIQVVAQPEGRDECAYHMNLFRPVPDIEPIDFNHRFDKTYSSPHCYVTKIVSPWCVEEKTGVNWVVASNILNSTPMSIPSGINNFKYDHHTHIFNLVHKHPHEYNIPFKTPVLALYPITELPLHVENYYDKSKCEELREKTSYKPYLRANMLKLSRDSS